MKWIFGGKEEPKEERKKVTIHNILVDIKRKVDPLKLSEDIDTFLAQGEDINRFYAPGLTLLHCAAREGNISAITNLQTRGAMLINSKYGTPFHLAAKFNMPLAIDQLFDSFGITKVSNKRDGKHKEDELDKDNLTPAMLAILHGNEGALRSFFYKSGINWQHRANGMALSAHDLAAQAPNAEPYYKILEEGMMGDKKPSLILTKDYAGKNCLDYAIERQNLRAFNYLLAHEHLKSNPKEVLDSLLLGKSSLEENRFQETEIYKRIEQEINIMQKLSPEQLSSVSRPNVLSSLGPLPVYESSHSATPAEESRSADAESKEEPDHEMKTPEFNAPVYDDAQITVDIAARNAKLTELQQKWVRDRSKVAENVDLEREKKQQTLGFRVNQGARDGTGEITERIDNERSLKAYEFKAAQVEGVVSVSEARRLAREREESKKPSASWRDKAVANKEEEKGRNASP